MRSHHLWFLIITVIIKHSGGFCNVGIVLTGGLVSTKPPVNTTPTLQGVLQCGCCADWGFSAHVGVYFPLRQSYAVFQFIFYPSSMSIFDER